VRLETFVRGPLQNNVYLLIDEATRLAAIIDPAIGSEDIQDRIAAEGLALRYILNTHGHFDHISGDDFFRKATGAHIAIHEADAPALQEQEGIEADILLRGGELLELGVTRIAVRHTPGHSPGSVCFLVKGTLFAGDTLFAGSVGRFDFPGGDPVALLHSIRQQVLSLPDETEVLPGHGRATTVGQERATNPFLQERQPGAVRK